jgi:hypothetical protein
MDVAAVPSRKIVKNGSIYLDCRPGKIHKSDPSRGFVREIRHAGIDTTHFCSNWNKLPRSRLRDIKFV